MADAPHNNVRLKKRNIMKLTSNQEKLIEKLQQYFPREDDITSDIKQIEEVTSSQLPLFWKELFSKVDYEFFEESYQIQPLEFDGMVIGESVVGEYQKLQEDASNLPEVFGKFQNFIPFGRTDNGNWFLLEKSPSVRLDAPLYYFDHEEDSIISYTETFEEYVIQFCESNLDIFE